ncbi:glutathione S-transferase [Xylariaceae sp. FL1272]|nr:glutathione S-transferase [Xylariaceae sp. FL1272]
MLVLRTLPAPESNVWYFAYGSNLDHNKFVVDRGITPLSSELMTMPGWSLEMNSAGFPYSEPSFGSVTYQGWSSREPGGIQVIGTAYRLNPKMYAKVLASEGGGTAYVEVEARAAKVRTEAAPDVQEKMQTFPVRTLVTVMRRVAKPSLRYMKLICSGAREARVPKAYQNYLEAIPVYRPPDPDGEWGGKTPAEKAAVFSWTAYQTAGLGPTAKYWLYFLMGYPNRQTPESLPKTVKKLHQNCVRQWEILEQRLSLPGQNYIALSDRPSIADISYFPFAMPWMFEFLGVDIANYPSIQHWGERMVCRPAVQVVLERGPTYGHALGDE